MEVFTDAAGLTAPERGVLTALESYSNVHRGSGHFSMATTHLYEKAREIVLEYLKPEQRNHTVIFCSSARAALLTAHLPSGSYTLLTDRETGLSLGVNALAVKRSALDKKSPFQAGGGTARLYDRNWVIWADAPDRFEAGTPAIVNTIAFAIALQTIHKHGKDATVAPSAPCSAKEILFHDDLQDYSGRELLERLRHTLIGFNREVPTSGGSLPFVNFDNGASTPTFRPVFDAVCRTWRQPAAVREEVIREVRSLIAGFLGAPQEQYNILFTSNTTEAIHRVAGSLAREAGSSSETVVLNTLLEHSSNELPWRTVPGLSLIRIGIDEEGFFDLKEMERLLREYNSEMVHGSKRIRLVAVSGASNVLGSFNDLEETGRIVHRYGARLLVDGAQMVAHRPVNLEASGIDCFAFSAHKVYAPFGTGVLVVKKDMAGFETTGAEPDGCSGEENPGGIAALGKALHLLQRIGFEAILEEEHSLTKYALQELPKVPGLKLYGITSPDSPRIKQKGGVILLEIKGKMATRTARDLAIHGGIGVRSGCHCAHLAIKHLLHFTPTLERIQRAIITLIPSLPLAGIVRISFGLQNRREEIDHLVSVLKKLPAKTRSTDKALMKTFVKEVERRVFGG